MVTSQSVYAYIVARLSLSLSCARVAGGLGFFWPFKLEATLGFATTRAVRINILGVAPFCGRFAVLLHFLIYYSPLCVICSLVPRPTRGMPPTQISY